MPKIAIREGLVFFAFAVRSRLLYRFVIDEVKIEIDGTRTAICNAYRIDSKGFESADNFIDLAFDSKFIKPISKFNIPDWAFDFQVSNPELEALWYKMKIYAKLRWEIDSDRISTEQLREMYAITGLSECCGAKIENFICEKCEKNLNEKPAV